MNRVLLLILCLFFAACSNDRHKDNILRLASETEIRSLDPRVGNDAPSIQVILMLFEGLFRKDHTDTPQPAICYSYEISPDKCSYVFYLRPTTWSDGSPVTAHDFEYAWKKAIDPAYATSSAYRFYPLKNAKKILKGKEPLSSLGVKALGKHTLKVELEYPAPYFLSMLSTTVYFPIPKHVAEANPRWAFAKDSNFVSNGPFSLVENRFKERLSFEKNAHYWDKEHVYLKGINLDIIPDTLTQYAMYDKGQLDFFGKPFSFLTCEALAEARQSKDFHTEDLYSVLLLFVNSKQPILSNVHFRKALTLAINRQAIIDHVMQEPAIVAMDLLPPNLAVSNRPYFRDNDIKLANKYLDQALEELGITKEELPRIELLFTDMRKNSYICQAVQDQWRKNLGINVSLSSREWTVLYQDAISGAHDIVVMSWFARIPDPEYLLETFKYSSDHINFSFWESEEYINCLDSARSSINAKRREEYLLRAGDILMENMPIIPIMYAKLTFLANPKLTGYTTSKLNEIDFKSAKIYN
ncbi:MAG: Oligopeptide-binding protein OppA [Chlamydiia bacterium]|nr:Oligopeptide-binding protein OppA [Chlamydiia bacterium]MCH9615865.1 Oligopeptide-binding protein OppA [Chlamydiia bacterium]MCH9628732.1 Oligopeptide-binding protein OppA [Chlamydiia bacterium]